MDFNEFKEVIRYSGRIDERRTRYTLYVSWVILPVTLFFPLFNTYSGTLAYVIMGIIAVILAANVVVYYSNWTTAQRIARQTLPLIGGLVAVTALLYFLYLGYGDGASAMWVFVLPLLAVFMLGLTWGLLTSVITLAASVMIMNAGTDIGGYNYSYEFTLRYVVAFVLVSALANGFEFWRVSLELQRDTINQELSRTRNALSEMANVCSWCNSIRSESGEWLTLEKYVSQQEDKLVSHAICPSCSQIQKANLNSE